MDAMSREAINAAISRLVLAHLDGHVTEVEWRRHGRLLGWAWWQAMGWGKVAREAAYAADRHPPPPPSVKGAVTREQWRVSWTMWVPERGGPQDVSRITDNEADARDQLFGLQSMVADHELRPCADHIWRPTLDCRTVWEGPWRAAGPPS